MSRSIITCPDGACSKVAEKSLLSRLALPSMRYSVFSLGCLLRETPSMDVPFLRFEEDMVEKKG